MEILFLVMLLVIVAVALGSGYPVAFALPGAAILTISLAAAAGFLFAGDVDAYFFQDGPNQWLSAGVTNLRGVYWEVERDTLIAIPLFIFMGIMLQRSKIAEDLLITMAQLFGPVPGGLGISVIFVGALLAATTGIVGATVVAMGLISLPAMLRNNYSKSLAAGTIAASGTLGQIIPPSIVLIILADQLASASDQASTLRTVLYKDSTGELMMPASFGVTSTSAGEMFLGALVPGLVLVGLYMLYMLVYALIRPKVAPAIPRDGALDGEFFFKLGLALIPPLTLIFVVLGSILAGVATVNQAGAIGAAGALIMASYRLTSGQRGSFFPALLALASLLFIGVAVTIYEPNIKAILTDDDRLGVQLAGVGVFFLLIALVWSAIRAYRIDNTLKEVMIETAKATSLVFIILLGAAMLTAAFRAFGGEELVRHFLLGLPGGFWTQFIMVMVVIFILGFFLDFIEIAVVVVPIVAPILLADPSANITAVWLGVMIGLNMQTSFLTPPFGFALFYLRGVAPAIVRTVDMYKGVIAFIVLQITALVVVANYPPLVNYLPNRVAFLSETAPPPRNPALQYCLEEYVTDRFQSTGSTPADQLDALRALDLNGIPEEYAESLPDSFDQTEEAVAKLAEANEAAVAVEQAKPAYQPLHRIVRTIQSDMRKLEARMAELKTRSSRLRGDDAEARKEAIGETIASLEAERDALEATIPAEWDERNAEFVTLNKAVDTARMQYQRAADGSYRDLEDVAAALASSDALRSVRDELADIAARLDNGEEADGIILSLIALGMSSESVYGTGSIQSDINTAREALTDEEDAPFDAAAAESALATAVATASEQLEWHNAVDPATASALINFEATLRESLGIRSQAKMTREQALFVASCNADHRDVSLNF